MNDFGRFFVYTTNNIGIFNKININFYVIKIKTS